MLGRGTRQEVTELVRPGTQSKSASSHMPLAQSNFACIQSLWIYWFLQLSSGKSAFNHYGYIGSYPILRNESAAVWTVLCSTVFDHLLTQYLHMTHFVCIYSCMYVVGMMCAVLYAWAYTRVVHRCMHKYIYIRIHLHTLTRQEIYASPVLMQTDTYMHAFVRTYIHSYVQMRRKLS